jgi:hypothetical protein
MIRNPAEILIHACALMTYWAGLYSSEIQQKLIDGVKVLLSCAHRVLGSWRSKGERCLYLDCLLHPMIKMKVLMKSEIRNVLTRK